LEREVSLKFDYLSNEVGSLWWRWEKGDKNVILVKEGDGVAIYITSRDQEKIIWTYGMKSCFVCLVVIQRSDKRRIFLFTHFPPEGIISWREKMRNLTRRVNFEKQERFVNRTKSLIFASGETREKRLRNIESSLREIFEGIVVRLERYPVLNKNGGVNQGVFWVNCSPFPKKVSYQSWVAQGEISF